MSDAAMDVLERMKAIHVSDYVFPGVKQDKPLSDMRLTATLKRMGRSDLIAPMVSDRPSETGRVKPLPILKKSVKWH